MTISSTTRRAGPFAGNNATAVFPFNFKIFDKTDVQVILTNASGATTALTLDSDYSVNVSADQNGAPGGSINYPLSGPPLPTGSNLVVLGSLPYTQPTDLTNQGGFYPSVLEDALDREEIQIQQLAEITKRSLSFPPAEDINGTLPSALQRAGTVLGFDSSGGPTYLPLPSSLGAGDLRFDTFVTGTGFTPDVTTQLPLSRAPISKGNTWVYWDGVPQLDFSLNGAAIIFPTPIPTGVNKVTVLIGTTLSVGVPAYQSVTDEKIATGTKLYNRINNSIDVKDPQFGAKGDGVSDDTTAIQLAISYASSIGGGFVNLPAGVFNISSTLFLAQGVSLIGAGSGRLYEDTTDKYVTTIRWNTPSAGGTMVDAGNLWHGTLQGIHFDGNAKATNILQLRGAQSSTFRDLLVRKTNNSIVGFGISLDMAGQTDSQYPTQFPSCSSNMFDSVMVMDMQYRALYLNGVITGGVNVSQITENNWINCQFRSFCVDNGAVVAFNQCCDTNTFYGGMIQCDGAIGTALVLNYSTDNGVFGNNFYGTAINGSVSGTGIDARNNAGPNSFFGCYMSAVGTPVRLDEGTQPGIIKLYGPNWGAIGNVGYLVPSQPVYGTSPWKYTNNNPYQVEFQMWGGTVSSITFGRNGSNSAVGGITPNLMSFLLEPGDSITIAASVAPALQIIPH